MKRLTIVRHAKSSWKDAALADRDRPLSRRGERDAPYMGTRLRARKARPSLIVTSPAKRALATAHMVATELRYPPESLQIEEALYLADVKDLLDVIAAQEARSAELMIVGHNPGLTDLANDLLGRPWLDNLPTASAVAIDFDAQNWREIASGRGTLVYFDYPKNPEAIVEH